MRIGKTRQREYRVPTTLATRQPALLVHALREGVIIGVVDACECGNAPAVIGGRMPMGMLSRSARRRVCTEGIGFN